MAADRADTDARSAAAIVEILPDIAILARLSEDNHEWRIVFINSAAERVFGPRAAVIGQPLRSLMADGSPFAVRSQREAFNAELRRRGELEFPGLTPVRDHLGTRRELRVRMRWQGPDDPMLILCEDVSERRAADDRSGATAGLRSAIALSGLLSHHVNNALAGALLNVAYAQVQLRRADPPTPGAMDALTTAAAGIQSAAAAIAELATARVDPDVTQSCDLVQALRVIAADDEDAPIAVEADGEPYYVWGSSAQIAIILGGILSVLRGRDPTPVRLALVRAAHEVKVVLAASTPDDAWLRVLLDPSEPQATSDERSVGLFASVQILRALGGQLGLPSWDQRGIRLELSFRAADSASVLPESATPVLLVSKDGALRALASAVLADMPLQFAHGIREGVVWLLRPGRGIVICDMDERETPVQELVAVQRLLGGDHAHRLILAYRRPPADSASDLPQLRIPFDKRELLALIDGRA
jgi:hypothetical protein